MAEIRLPCGLIALVDDEDFERVSTLRWHAHHKHHTIYVEHRIYLPSGKRKRIRLHRFILRAAPGIDVDHKDGNGLDNRKRNLRRATKRQNAVNRRPVRLGLKGVFKRQSGKWRARIKVNGKSLHLGTFESEEAAGGAYDAAAVRFFGEFAKLNFPPNRFGEVDAAA